MKTLIFSDTHLTSKFDQRKFNFLAKIINSADQVIINGDFWDNWFIDFDDFINSKWNKLFPLLLKKNCIYIVGNHDPEKEISPRASLFATKICNDYLLKSDKQFFQILHGDKIVKQNQSKFLQIYKLILDKTCGRLLGNILRHLLHSLEWLSFSILGSDFMANTHIAKNNNLLLKAHNQNSERWLICGHSHRSEINDKFRFANSGSIIYGAGSYLIIEDGEVELHKETY